MNIELIKRLLESLETGQYISALRKVGQQNKRLRIPGFTKIEKAPLAMVCTAANKSDLFSHELLLAIDETVFLSDYSKETDQIDEIKDSIPCDQWPGVVADLLLKGKNSEAELLLNAYVENKRNKMQNQSILPLVKDAKKEEKFRIKYMREHEALEEVRKENQDLKARLDAKEKLVEDLEECQKKLNEDLESYRTEIEKLEKIRQKLQENCKALSLKNEGLARAKIKILAPNCKDVLEKYTDLLQINFEFDFSQSVESICKQYTEIWVFPDLIPYREYRMLKKLKNHSETIVKIFENLTGMVDCAEELIKETHNGEYGV